LPGHAGDVLNDAFETLNVLNASFRTSPQPDTFALPLDRLRMGTMVTGVHYRHPAVLANMAATVDIISGGRLDLGIGAGCNEQESGAYGIELGTLRERFDRFDEACEVLVSLLSNDITDFDGEYYQLTDAHNEPKGPQRPHPPILIGGVGEKRTLRAVARHAQIWDCSLAKTDELPHKREVLRAHCKNAGRDPEEILLSSTSAWSPAGRKTCRARSTRSSSRGSGWRSCTSRRKSALRYSPRSPKSSRRYAESQQRIRRSQVGKGRLGCIIVAVVGVVIAGSALWVITRGSTPTPGCTVSAGTDQYTLSPEQMGNAATIVGVGTKQGLPAHAATIAIATALQESKLRNLPGGDRDSVGLFQQRPSQGWGTVEQISNPVYSATAFYQKLASQPDWTELSVTVAAQRVQRSGAPDAYAQWESEARAIAMALTGQQAAALTCHDITVGAPVTDLVALANAELGTAQLSGRHPAAQGWSISSWLVAHAISVGVDTVTYDGRTWTAASGSWTAPGASDGMLSLHLVPANPAS